MASKTGIVLDEYGLRWNCGFVSLRFGKLHLYLGWNLERGGIGIDADCQSPYYKWVTFFLYPFLVCISVSNFNDK